MEFLKPLQRLAGGPGHWVKEVGWFCGGFWAQVVTEDHQGQGGWANQAETKQGCAPGMSICTQEQQPPKWERDCTGLG